MTNKNPDTLALFTTLLNLPDIAVTKICHSPDGREVTIVVKSIREILTVGSAVSLHVDMD